MLETRRHHANNRDALSIEPQGTSNDVRVTGKAPHPEAVTKHDDLIGARLIFFGRKHASEGRVHAQHWKKVGRDSPAVQSLGRFARLGAVGSGTAEETDVLGDIVLLAIVQKVGD